MKTIRFGSVAEFRNGVNYDADGAEACAKVIGVGDFGSLSRLSNFLHIGEIRLSSPLSDQDCLVDGDLLFVRSNGSKKLVGRCMLIENPPALMTHSGFTIRARVDSQKYLPAFVAAIFQTEAIHKQAHLEGTGTNISNLSQQILSGIRLPSFTIQEQLDYLQRVDIWDAAIEKATALLAALEQRKQGLMQQLLTGRRRLKGFKGKWNEVTLDNVLERITRKNSDSCNNALTVSAQRGLVAQGSYFAKQIAAEANEHYVLLKRGEFAYNRSAANGYPFGAIKRLDSHEEGIVSTLCLCFGIRHEDVLDSDFLVWLIEAGRLNRAICKIAHEGARSHGLLNVTAKDFFDIKTTVPGFPEQRAIAAIMNDTQTEIDALRGQVEAVKTQKRALMQKLLSGDWRMPKTAHSKEFSA